TNIVDSASTEATPSREAAVDEGPTARDCPSATTTIGSRDDTAAATEDSSIGDPVAMLSALVRSGTAGRRMAAASTTASPGPGDAAALVTSTVSRPMAPARPGEPTTSSAAVRAASAGNPASIISSRSQLETIAAT